jgi:aminomethyltransferase
LLQKTALYEKHLAAGGKIVEFAGFLMPIQYTSILDEHRKVRNSVGVFDVSHMGEIKIQGRHALQFVNYITTNDVSNLEVNQAQYTAMCYPDGGIVDDLICYRRQDQYLLVVNASNTEKDFEWILENKVAGVEINNISNTITQLAIQGRNAEVILQKLTKIDLSKIKFYCFEEGKLAEVNMIISRTGYTGEPGFELYFPREYSEDIWDEIFRCGKKYEIAPIGLGARDTLRLEKKYCLYGNDINQNTNPIEAGLGWITKLNKGDFIGREAIQKVKDQGPVRKLVGFICDGKVIPRYGYPIELESKKVGEVTSGCYSPVLEKNIGLGLVRTDLCKIDTKLTIKVRGRELPITIVKTPFV